jgi:hypothetical protein
MVLPVLLASRPSLEAANVFLAAPRRDSSLMVSGCSRSYDVGVAFRMSSGHVTAPGRVIAAYRAWSRYACGSTPASFAVSHRV